MITMGPLFGFLACGPAPAPLFTPNRVAGLMLVFMADGVMTYYTRRRPIDSVVTASTPKMRAN